jgi:repressor LexA
MPQRSDDAANAETLSPIQTQMLHFLHVYIKEQGYPPTLREIATAVRLRSRSAVAYQLDQLKVKGYIRRDLNVQRGIVILAEPESSS